MPMHIRRAGGWSQVTNPELRVGGAWTPINNAWVMKGGVWQKFYQRVPIVENVSVVVNFAPCDGGGEMNVAWDASPSDQVAVATFDLTADITDAAYGQRFVFLGSGSSADNFNASLCPDSFGSVLVEMKIGGVTVASNTGFF